MGDATQHLEAIARELEASGEFRVLRKLGSRLTVTPADGAQTRLGLFLDVETTGLDPSKDEIIELAMVPFTYSLDGRISEVRTPYQQLRQPTRPIPPEITALTGITNDMVAGHAIDPNVVTPIVSDADLILAHNAAFDRRFAERLLPCFVTKPWACSMTQVNWSAEGFEGTKLSYLAMGAGFFYDRHRASSDCFAAIELLAARLPKSGKPALANLLERARAPSWRIWADGSPFEMKGVLKARGYRWSGDNPPRPRTWYIDVDDETKDTELSYLSADIYGRTIELPVQRVTALERFSDRT